MNRALLISDENIINKIFLVRGKKVMLDKDLAALYGVSTGNLNKAVKRNPRRFPDDFMFRLSDDEFKNLIFQNGTSSHADTKTSWGGTRKSPFAFTEQGVAMLSSVLNSNRAIEVNIRIIRIFTSLREMLLSHKDILLKLEEIERKISSHDEQIQLIFEYLKRLISHDTKSRKRIGYKISGNPDELAEPVIKRYRVTKKHRMKK